MCIRDRFVRVKDGEIEHLAFVARLAAGAHLRRTVSRKKIALEEAPADDSVSTPRRERVHRRREKKDDSSVAVHVERLSECGGVEREDERIERRRDALI